MASGDYSKTEEGKKKLKERMTGNKYSLGVCPSKETREKMSVAHKGCKNSMFGKTGKNAPAFGRKGEKHPMFGKRFSDDSRRKIGEKVKLKWQNLDFRQKQSMAHKGLFIGEKGSNWQGGKSFEPYSIDWTRTLRRAIRERDKYTCQICGAPQEDRVFAVHHIDGDKQNCDPINLITLCGKCHSKITQSFYRIRKNRS